MISAAAVNKSNMPSFLRAACIFLAASIALVFAVVVTGLVHPAYAEGSKELVSQGGYRPYLEQYGSLSAGESRLTEVGVYVQAGETVYFGSSVKKANLGLTNEKMGTEFTEEELADLNNNHIIVCNPHWDREKNPQAYPYVNGIRESSIKLFRVDETIENELRGYIADYAEEQAGPAIKPRQEGYSPQSFTAKIEGIYYFKFFSSAGTTCDPCPVIAGDTEDFEKNQGTSTVAAWDITVYNADAELQSGRVFVDELYLNMGGTVEGQNVLMSSVYVLTEDGYEYQVDFKGMDPSILRFYSNLRGPLLQTEGGYQSLYHSVKSSNRALSDLIDYGITNNIKPTEEVDKTHRIFFNPPDSYVLEQYTGSETLSEGLAANIDAEIDLKFNASLNPYQVEQGTVIGSGGTFSFENDGSLYGSSFQISLDFGTVETPENKVILSNALVEGTNSVYWDGYDQYGNVVGVGVYDKEVVLEIKGGEAHFPLIDVPNNKNGVRITMLNDISSVSDKTKVHYNNLSEIKAYTGVLHEGNWTILDGEDNRAGVSSVGGVMAYENNAGSQTLLDIWSFEGKSISLPFSFEVYDGDFGFAVSTIWDLSGDTSESAPQEGETLSLQLQWRIKGSGGGWTNYAGIKTEYYEPVLYEAQTNYDPRNPLFTGLEQYVGRNAQGTMLLYQYRVICTDVPPEYELVSQEFEAFDLNGIGHAVLLQYAYSPDKGVINVSKSWEGDGAAADVRPSQLRLTLYSRVAGIDDEWQEFEVDNKDSLILASNNGWSNSILVPYKNEKEQDLEYSLAVTSYAMSEDPWVDLWLSYRDSSLEDVRVGTIPEIDSAEKTEGEEASESGASEETLLEENVSQEISAPEDAIINAPGYSTLSYQVDSGEISKERSGAIRLNDRVRSSEVLVSDMYRTCLTVSLTMESGSNDSEESPVSVQLTQDGVDVENAVAELTNSNSSYTFENLETGHTYSTHVVSSSENYRITKEKTSGKSGYSIIENKTQRGYFESYRSVYLRTSFTVNKEWFDGQINHDPVMVELSALFNDGREPYRESAELSAENDWKHTFRNVMVGGDMSVSEISALEGFVSEYSTVTGSNQNGYTQTISNVADKGTITIIKEWDGDGNATGVRPDAVKVELQYRKKGSTDAWQTYSVGSNETIELSSFNRWTVVVEVPLLDGEDEREYYVQELSYKASGEDDFTPVKNESYALGYDQPNYTVNGGPKHEFESVIVDFEDRTTATVTIKNAYTTVFTAVAAWQNGEGDSIDNARSISIQLLKDGEAIDGEVVVLDSENPTHTFTDLETGYQYSVQEISEDSDYEESYTAVEGEDGYSVIGNETERGYYQGITSTKIVDLGKDDLSETRQTENAIAFTLVGFGLIALAAAVGLLVMRIRKKSL